jgi:predicted esterase
MVHVPANYDGKGAEKYPLVVALHGYNGSPRRILEAFLDEREPKAKVPGFVIAPDAHGNAFYRGPGEHAVYDALDWAEITFPIDRQRTSITGVSMGGTGAAEIAFRRSERFSAAAPLCGYQSFLVRRDTANKPLRNWEKHLIHLYSPASWAASGSDLPLFVAHGTKDLPLENSRVLTNRYRELGFHLEQDWPNLGHSVWTKTYRNAGLFPWLSKWQKDTDPDFVSLTTGQLRHARKFWLEITAFEHRSELPHVDARAESKQRVTLHSQAVTGLCLHQTSHLDETGPLSVSLDDQNLEVPAGQPRCFEKKGAWMLAPREIHVGNKRAGVEGPWSDLLGLPLVVVYGSQNPNTVLLNRYVADHLFAPPYGVTLNIPVVSDVKYARGHFPQRRVVYVGRAEDHLQLSAIKNQLPLQTMAEGLVVGNTVFKEPDVGAAFVYRDPERRDGLLGVVTGNGPEGLLRVLSLPQLVPDFVVFDHGLDAAAGEPILGPSAYVRAAGFFENDWSLPSDITDSYASERPR